MEKYVSDLKDKEWEEIEELFAVERMGRRRQHSQRAILNGIYYVLKTGCQWRMLPKEYPKWETVYWYFQKWSRKGIIEKIHSRLRKKQEYWRIEKKNLVY
jgi:transposase